MHGTRSGRDALGRRLLRWLGRGGRGAVPNGQRDVGVEQQDQRREASQLVDGAAQAQRQHDAAHKQQQDQRVALLRDPRQDRPIVGHRLGGSAEQRVECATHENEVGDARAVKVEQHRPIDRAAHEHPVGATQHDEVGGVHTRAGVQQQQQREVRKAPDDENQKRTEDEARPMERERQHQHARTQRAVEQVCCAAHPRTLPVLRLAVFETVDAARAAEQVVVTAIAQQQPAGLLVELCRHVGTTHRSEAGDVDVIRPPG
eukprot:2977532-Prymnesium_polylepis.1